MSEYFMFFLCAFNFLTLVLIYYIWNEYQNTYEDVKGLMNEFIINHANVNEKINEVLDLDLEKYLRDQKTVNERFTDFIAYQKSWNKYQDESTVRLLKNKKGITR